MTPPIKPEVAPWLAQWIQAQAADASRTPTPNTAYPTIGPDSGAQRRELDMSIPSDAYGDMRDILTQQGGGAGVLDFVPGLAGLRGAVRASRLSRQGRGAAAAVEAATSVLPEAVAGAAVVKNAGSRIAGLVGPKGNREVQAVGERLLHDIPSMARVSSVNAEKAGKMAKVYEGLPTNDPAARKAYDALNAEVDKQYKAAQDAGYSFEFTDADPYKGSGEMMKDVQENRRLKVFKTPADNFHPYMTPEQNDKFRAVHDWIAHAGPGNQFGPVGEENAYRMHAATLSPDAQQALASETRGQNSWVNFGPNAHLPVTERPFAEQKAALWPREYLGDYSAMPGPGRGRGAVLGSRADDLQRELGYDHRASTEARSGSTRRVFHGTNTDFTSWGNPNDDLGIHFGAENQAQERTRWNEMRRGQDSRSMRILPADISLHNPLRLQDAFEWSNPEIVKETLEQAGFAYRDLKPLASMSDIRDFLRSKGYDGVVYQNEGEIPGMADIYQELEQALAANDSPRLEATQQKARRLRAEHQADSYIVFDPKSIQSPVSAADQSNIPGPAVAHNPPMSMTVNGWDDALPEVEREGLSAWEAGHEGKYDELPPMAQRSLSQLEAHGRQHGVAGLGTASPEHKVKLTDGTEVNVPGGFEGTFTPYDLFALKAQGINPNLLPEGVHEQIHQKLLRTHSHDSGDDLQLFKGLLFGITSPNSPLTPNEFTVARLMPRSMDDIKKLGEMRGADIPAAFGIDAASKGGIGTRGSVDYEKVSELARMFHENPGWFRRMSDEGWDEYADRIATQVGGLGTKTASLGAVWDDVAGANTSAVDRHMITDAWDELMQDKALMRDFKPRVVSSWNNPENIGVPKGAKKARSLADILKQPGGQIFARDFMQGLATEPVSGVFRNSKGAFGASVPEKMKGLSWIREPEVTNTMNPYYRKILGLQEKVRPKNMSLFGNQWLRWDRMRGRIEPHEVMHPDLHKLPPMSLDDVRASLDAHSQAGYKLGRPSVNNPAATGAVLPAVKPVADPRNLMYWGLGGLLGATAGSTARRGLLADAQ